MTINRRTLLVLGGGAAASLMTRPAWAADTNIIMQGTANGARVWFEPNGILVAPRTTVRWTNRDAGNAHTTTAFTDRIPAGAKPWDSDYLLPDETFELTLDIPGVYDYFCTPHLHAGMVGRILVGTSDTTFADYPPGELAEVVLDQLPPIGDIVAQAG